MYEVKAKDRMAFDALVKLHEESANYDFWSLPSGLDRSMDILVPPAFQQTFVHLMRAFNIEYRIKIADVQRYTYTVKNLK